MGAHRPASESTTPWIVASLPFASWVIQRVSLEKVPSLSSRTRVPGPLTGGQREWFSKQFNALWDLQGDLASGAKLRP